MFKKFTRMALIAAALGASIGIANASMYTLLPVAARTATTTTADITKTTEVGAHFILNVTAVPGVDTLTMSIQGKDNLGNYYTLLTGTASAATGIVVLKVSPSIAPLASGSANDMLPDIYRVVVTHSAGTSFTYSLTQNTWTSK